MFSKAFVINLPFKADRLEQFQKSVPKCFGEVQVWPAVHGDSIQHPDWWQAGAGAWGCYRSHMQILEHCYQQGYDSYVVFEDDAIFRENAEELATQFMSSVPQGWDMLYLGGQLLHETQNPPKLHSEGVYVPYNVNRTHCFAVSKSGYPKVYKHLCGQFSDREHIDHHLGRLHESGTARIYIPGKWIVGQDSGRSNISGNYNAATYWVDPEHLAENAQAWTRQSIPAVYLDAPIDVAIELERRGWHRGHWQTPERLDRGLQEWAVNTGDIAGGVQRWYSFAKPEAIREGRDCVCLYHPQIKWEGVQGLHCAEFHRIAASTADEAQSVLAEIIKANPIATSPIVTRNLIYHIYPIKGNGIWQWNVQQLLKRIDQFDGVRSIAVVVDDKSDSLEDVQAAFSGTRIDTWICMPNDPVRGESVTHAVLLDTLPRDNSITFRAHAKSVRHDGQYNTQRWAEVMYEVCLDDPEHVAADLEQHSATGPFRLSAGHQHGWHYSGSFFWFKNSHLFRTQNWRNVTQDYFGVEKWPGEVFTEDQGGCLFGSGAGWLYHDNVWAWVEPWLSTWKSSKRDIGKAQNAL